MDPDVAPPAWDTDRWEGPAPPRPVRFSWVLQNRLQLRDEACQGPAISGIIPGRRYCFCLLFVGGCAADAAVGGLKRGPVFSSSSLVSTVGKLRGLRHLFTQRFLAVNKQQKNGSSFQPWRLVHPSAGVVYSGPAGPEQRNPPELAGRKPGGGLFQGGSAS